MTYTEATRYLLNALPMYQRIGGAAYKADLNNANQLDTYFNHPHRSFKTIHVAGTNGKGSVSHMLASVMQSAGYKTGLFTSPHLLDFRERIRVNGKPITKSFVTRFTEQNQEIFSEIQLSFFEMSVFMAFTYFTEQKIDIAIIEVGLGGRLDTTNIITPLVSIITNIGLDHTKILGSNLESIALEKAGIIKSNIPVVVGESHIITRPVFEKIAGEKNSSIVFADDLFIIDYQKENMDGSISSHFKRCPFWNFEYLTHDLKGIYQRKNIPVVLMALAILNDLKAIRFQHEDIKQGLNHVIKNTGLMGRWQIEGEKPMIVCDVAHNADGFKTIAEQIRNTPFKNLYMVLGFVEDKSVEPIVEMLPANAHYFLCQADIPRAMKVEQLSGHFAKQNRTYSTYIKVSEAFKEALKLASPQDFIYIGGSTFVVADFLTWKKKQNSF